MSTRRVLHYEILRTLGRGGMGEVVEAQDLRLGRRVALKFITAAAAGDEAYWLRFQREARAAAAMSHPNIATIHAFELDGDSGFIVMELLEGGSVRGCIQAGSLSWGDALGITRAVLAGLAHAQSQGVTHRDVKPDNVLFDAHGTPKLTDFGLAHIAGEHKLTVTGGTMGTAAYMPPETVRGEWHPHGDVFSCGVMAFQMLTGRLPFEAANPLGMMYAIANDPVPRLDGLVAGVDERVDRLVVSMLERDPEKRPGAAQALAALNEILPALRPEVLALRPVVAPVAAANVETGAPTAVRGPSHSALETAAPAVRASDAETLPIAKPRSDADTRTMVARPAASADASAAPSVAPRRARLLAMVVMMVLVGIAAISGYRRWSEARSAQARQLNDEAVQLMNAGDVEQAGRRLEQAVALDGRQPEVQINLAEIERTRGDVVAAARRLRELIERLGAPEEARHRALARGVLADIAIDQERFADAISELERAFAEDSSQARAYNQLGWALAHGGEAARAAALLGRGVQRFPTEPALHKNLAIARLGISDDAGAKQAALDALALDPTMPGAHGALARAHARLGDQTRALAEWFAFQRLPESGPDSLATVLDLRKAGVLQ